MQAKLSGVMIVCVAAGATPAYSQDYDAAAERARLANERIQIEAERRAEEEEKEAAQQASLDSAPQPPAAPVRPPPGSSRTGGAAAEKVPGNTGQDDRMSRMLEQIRTLGELHDAGYVTDAEFSRIKRKILDSELGTTP